MQKTALTELHRIFGDIFNLRRDMDEKGTVEIIRKNVDFHSANAWTLVFAIFVASIGLNMNSTAVIIGAMLISPLMGPILGFGLALGINDDILLKKSLRNLSIAVVISILTSTLYFLLSPFHEIQSELLARTQPTFYDVMIAFFGGAAGIVSISRTERGQSVAGVAIATALMPPLCTAGYALSMGNLKFLAGALFLFLINGVFIALSTFVFVRYMRFQLVSFQDKDEQTRVRRWIAVVVLAVVAPSIAMAWILLKESRFKMKAENYIREQFHFKNSFIVDQDIKFRYRDPKITINVIGNKLSNEQIRTLRQNLAIYDLADTELVIHQITGEAPNAASTDSHTAEVAQLRHQLAQHKENEELSLQIKNEISTVFPVVSDVLLIKNMCHVVIKKKAAKEDLTKMEKFLQTRLANPELKVNYLIPI